MITAQWALPALGFVLLTVTVWVRATIALRDGNRREAQRFANAGIVLTLLPVGVGGVILAGRFLA